MDAKHKKEYRQCAELPYFVLFLFLSLSLFLFSGCSNAKQALEQKATYAIRVATDFREEDLGYQQLCVFAQSLSELSDGALEVKLYKKGEWSEAERFAEYVTCGSLEMACVPITQAIALQPIYAIYEQPYLFSDLKAVEEYSLSNAAQNALRLLPQSYYGLGFVASGYNYLVQKESLQSLSYGSVKHLAEIHELDDAVVYDVRAQYDIQPLIVSSKWWNTLTESEQTWIQESFNKSLKYILEYQREFDSKPLEECEIIVQSVLPVGLSEYTERLLSQREAYFSSHSDTLTAYWRPTGITTMIGKET